MCSETHLLAEADLSAAGAKTCVHSQILLAVGTEIVLNLRDDMSRLSNKLNLSANSLSTDSHLSANSQILHTFANLAYLSLNLENVTWNSVSI